MSSTCQLRGLAKTGASSLAPYPSAKNQLNDPALARKLKDFRAAQRARVAAADDELQRQRES